MKTSIFTHPRSIAGVGLKSPTFDYVRGFIALILSKFEVTSPDPAVPILQAVRSIVMSKVNSTPIPYNLLKH